MINKNVSKSSGNPIIDKEDLKSVASVIAKNWYIIIAAILIAYVASYIYLYKITNVFGAQTQLALESSEKINERSIIGENFGSYYNWWNMNSENVTAMRVIKSYDLIENAVKRLKLNVSYFIVGRIKTTELYNSNPYEIVVEAINPKYYEKEIGFKILDEKRYQLIFTNDGDENVKEGFFDKEYLDLDIKLTIKNKSITKENAQNLSQSDYEIVIHNTSTLVYRFQQALNVENTEGTKIFQITVEDVIPERAKAFLDTLTSAYIENSLLTRFQINTNTLNYIEKQMAEVTNVLNNIEDSLQAYKESRNILNLNKEEEDYFSKMRSYDEKKINFQLELGALNSLEKYIIEDKDPQFLPPEIYLASNDVFLKKGTEELYNLQIKANQNLSVATDNNYSIQETKRHVKKLKENLLIYIHNSKTAIYQNINDIESQIQYYVSNIKSIPKKQREILGIQRNLEVNQKMYLFLLEKKSNTIIGRAGIFPQIKVIETARIVGVVRPNQNKVQLTFMACGAILASAIVFIRMTFYSKIEDLNQLKKLTSYPVIGEIIYSPHPADWAIGVEKENKLPVVESFRSIRTNLQYMAVGNTSKIVVITSNNPGEGKTFTSVNIGAVIAMTGKKVLLLELDLHKPKIHKVLKLMVDKGISTVLIGKSKVEEAILPTGIKNMDVLPVGPIPPNPSELVHSELLKDILRYAKENYEFVIIDTPPIGLISDALILMKYADINLFVINTKFNSKDSISNIEDIVESHQLKNFAYILNGVKIKYSKYFNNRYAYGDYGYVKNTESGT